MIRKIKLLCYHYILLKALSKMLLSVCIALPPICSEHLLNHPSFLGTAENSDRRHTGELCSNWPEIGIPA
jgi:hypothetical protein